MFGPGYDGSLNYLVRVLRNAGYDPQITPFNFPFWEETAPPVLNQVTPTAKSYVPGDASTSDTPGVDFISMPGSPSVSLNDVPVVPAAGTEIPPAGRRRTRRRADALPRTTRPPWTAPSRWSSAASARSCRSGSSRRMRAPLQ